MLRLLSLPLCGRLARIHSRTAIRLAARHFIARPERRTEEWVETTRQRLSIPGGREVFLDVVRHTLRVRGVSPEWRGEIDSVLRSLQTPVLIVHGRQDKVIPVANVEYARRLIPQCEVRLFERCGHELPYECADDFNRETLNFLSRDLVLRL
jgi:2-hydroxymuconate-semialdehyde hydrolase